MLAFFFILLSVFVCVWVCVGVKTAFSSLLATKTYLERELAEAVQEEETSTTYPATTTTAQLDSGSDSDYGEGPYPFPLQQPPIHSINSLEASMWSLDVSSTSASSMENSSCTETEV